MTARSATNGRLLLLTAVALNVGGAVLVSALQVWSASAAPPREYLGRPVLVVILTAPLLLGRFWGRWPASVVGAATAIWLVRAALSAAILPSTERAGVGLAAVIVIAAALLPWHPMVREALRDQSAKEPSA